MPNSPQRKKITDRGLKYAHLRVQISTFEGANMHIGAPLKLALGVPPPLCYGLGLTKRCE